MGRLCAGVGAKPESAALGPGVFGFAESRCVLRADGRRHNWSSVGHLETFDGRPWRGCVAFQDSIWPTGARREGRGTGDEVDLAKHARVVRSGTGRRVRNRFAARVKSLSSRPGQVRTGMLLRADDTALPSRNGSDPGWTTPLHDGAGPGWTPGARNGGIRRTPGVAADSTGELGRTAKQAEHPAHRCGPRSAGPLRWGGRRPEQRHDA
jgi:hypothetical protein